MSSDAPTSGSNLVLGAGMARRSRSQSVLARHRTSATLVGAVGRACVGFGLAVGRSRSIRPMVNLSDVNSATLRPPTNFWRESVTDEPIGVADNRSVATAPTSAQRVVRRSADRRPTWTDQVIQRSGIGYTAPPAGALAEPVGVPDDFQPFGDPKLDHLRLLRRAAVSAPAAETRPVQPRRAARPTDDRRGDTVAESVDGGRVRGDTAAGRGTGPGRLARAVLPEPVAPRSVAAVGRPGPGSTVGSELPGTRSPDEAPVRRSPQRRQTQAPSRLDTLRALLVEQGKLSADPQAVGPSGSAATGDEAQSSSSSDVARRRPADAARDGRAPQAPPLVAPRDAGRPAAPTSAGRPRPAAESAVGDGRAAATDTDTPPMRSGPPGSSTRSETTRSSTPGPDGGGVESRRVGGSVPNDVARSARVPATNPEMSGESTSIRRQLRTQRLLSSGLAPGGSDVREPAGEPRATMPSDQEVTRPAGMTVRPPDAVPSPEAGAVSTIQRAVSAPATLPWSGQRPELPSAIATAPGAVIRRVTLPRALSSSYRPETVLTAHRIGSRPVPPTSTGVMTTTPTAAGAPTSLAQDASDRAAATERSPGEVDPRRSTGAPSLRTSALPVTALESMSARTTTTSESTPGSTTSPGTSDAMPASVAPRHVPVDRRAGVATTSPVGADALTTRPPAIDSIRRSSVLPAGAGALQQVLRRTAESPVAPVADLAVSSTVALTTTSSDDRISTDRSTRLAGDSRSEPRAATATAPSHVDRAAPTATPSVPGRAAVSTSATLASAGAVAPPVVRRAPADTQTSTELAGSSTAPVDTRPAERLADQFMTELSQTIRRTPAPLPMPFRPMSDAITGGRRVMLSTDPASRRALRSVGKIAATTGDTIHLDHAAIPRRRLDEVVAHELTHVAHPSPTPRFFDDIDDSPEERRAEKVASIMARSPLRRRRPWRLPAHRPTRSGVRWRRRAAAGPVRRPVGRSRPTRSLPGSPARLRRRTRRAR